MSPSPIRIRIDRDVCAGSGVCIIYASGTFDLDEDTKAIVVTANGDPLEQVEAAADGCPTGAITVVTDAGGWTGYDGP